MHPSPLNRQRQWWRIIWRAALVASLVGFATSAVVAIYGHRDYAVGTAILSWVIFCFGVICVRSQWAILTEPYGLDGVKELRPFPPEFERPPEFFGSTATIG